jgi:predicted ATP-grasp superfamily ATP-dependent carboligase
MGEQSDHVVPAIVLGRGPTALGILRSLRLAGIPTYVACPPGDHVTLSRWYRPTPGDVPWDGTVGPQAYELLRRMPLDKAVVIPGADDAALWLADLPRSDLGTRFRVSTSSCETQEILQDKSRFAAYLEGTGIAHPRTFLIENEADIEAIPFDELDRVFIKPVNSQKFSDVNGVKGVWVKSKPALRDAWLRLHVQGFRLMAQEYVPGSAADHFFVDGFRDGAGQMTGLFTRQRLRMAPADFGNSSYCRSIALDDLASPVQAMRQLLAGLDYRGIFSAEFKRDARDGQYRIIEVNTRAWTYVEFAARCGVNVCAMAYQDALGQPVTPASTDYVVKAGCVDLYRDIGTVWNQRRIRRNAFPQILMQWARAHYHSFRIDDPRPGLSVARQVLTKLLRPRPDAVSAT